MLTPEQDRAVIEWREADQQLAAAKANELTKRNAAIALCFPTVAEGVNRFPLGNGYALKCEGRLNYKLDSDTAKVDAVLDRIEKAGNEGPFLASRLIKWKPELSTGEYKKLDPNAPEHATIKALVNTILTITPGLPGLTLEEPKTGNGK
jgi:hypothetical protein